MSQRKRYSLVIVAAVIALLVVPFGASAQSDDKTKATMAAVNEKLQAMGEKVRLEVVEYLTAWDEAGKTIYFDDRTKWMGSDWVPGDPRRGGFYDITWLSDQVEGTANGVALADTQTAVSNAMDTWNRIGCSTIPLTQLSDYGVDWGYVQYLFGFGGTPDWYADITHAGWLPGTFFDTIGESGASNYILGVTFTFTWVDPGTGEITDLDNNGKLDVAFRETYYNNNFPWGIDTGYPIDVESTVLHEAGHGLSQGHFGKLFETDANGKLHFAPLAVMNAGYTGVQQELTGTDIGGHCGIWGAWPNK